MRSLFLLSLCTFAAHGYRQHGMPARSPLANAAATSARPSSIPNLNNASPKGPQFRLPMLLPALSYTSLAGATAGALHLLQPVMAWQGVALVAYSVGVPTVMVLSQLALFGGSGVAKAMGGTPTDDPRLKQLAHEAAAAVGVSPPNVFEIKSREPNAFAASSFGTRDATVAVTTGLREILTEDELGAVLAHEMGHLRHSDVVRNMHVAAAAAGLGGIYEIGRMLVDSSSRKKRGGKKKDEDGDSAGSLGLMLMAGGAATQAAAHGLRLMASRGAELKADRAAAEAYGVDAMVSALRKIERHAARRPADLRNSAAGQRFAFAMISDGASPATPAPGAGGRDSWWNKAGRVFNKMGEALRTHPTMEKRVQALEDAAAAGLAPRRSQSQRSRWW